MSGLHKHGRPLSSFRFSALCISLNVVSLLVILYCILLRTMFRHSIAGSQLVMKLNSEAIPVLVGSTFLASRNDREERLSTEQPRGPQLYVTNPNPQDFLVFFPIYGLEQKGRPNTKMHIERFVI